MKKKRQQRHQQSSFAGKDTYSGAKFHTCSPDPPQYSFTTIKLDKRFEKGRTLFLKIRFFYHCNYQIYGNDNKLTLDQKVIRN